MRSRLPVRRMRQINATIAASMLVVPASAFALNSTTTAHDSSVPTTTLPMQVSPRRVGFGDPVHIAGAAPAAAPGQSVLLEADYGHSGSWQRLATTAVGSSGRFAFRPRLHQSALLRAVLASTASTQPATTTPQANGAAAAPAQVTPVQVSAQLRTAENSRNVLAGGTVRVAGKLLPGTAKRTVALQAHSGSGWRTLTRARTGRRGTFALRFSPSATGPGRRLRVTFGGDRTNASAAKSAGEVTVYEPTVASWYNDGGNTACGFHAGLGVANRTLPCGTKVRFRYGGRSVVATVDDRGPFVGGRDWDLNQNTAAALGFAGVGTVWASS